MRTCCPCGVPRGAARRTVLVQALREPAVGGAVRPGLDYLARWGAGGRAPSRRIPQRGVTATGVPLRRSGRRLRRKRRFPRKRFTQLRPAFPRPVMPRLVASGPEVPVIRAGPGGAGYNWPCLSRRKAFYGRGGNCCSAQVLPSGSLKVTNEPHGVAGCHAVRDELPPGRLDIGHDALHALLRARRHRRDPGAKHDRARRTRRGELHEPQRVVHLVIVVSMEADLLHVECLGAIDIGHRYRHQLDLPVHRARYTRAVP